MPLQVLENTSLFLRIEALSKYTACYDMILNRKEDEYERAHPFQAQ